MARNRDLIRMAVPAALFAVALIVRCIGIRWSLPTPVHTFSYHPDESLLLAVSQQLDLLHGRWDPQYYNYGALYLYLLNIISMLVNGYAGFNQSTPEYQQIGAYLLAGRLMNACMGAGCAVAAYAIGRRVARGSVGEAPAGWLAGAIVAFAPALVVHSRFQTVDVPALFFLSIALVYALKITQDADEQRTRNAAVCGLFAGLAASVKYNNGLVLLAAVAAIGLVPSSVRVKLRRIGVSVVCATVAFVVTTPGSVFSFPKFWADLSFERRHMADPNFDLTFQQTAPGWLYHITPNLTSGFGTALLIVCAAGLFAAMVRGRREAWVLGIFGLAYYAFIGSFQVKFLRYTFPLYPVLAAGAGCLAQLGSARRADRRPRWQLLRPSSLGWLALALALPLTWRYTLWMVRPDPRDLAAGWMRSHEGASIGLPTAPWFYTPPFFRFTNAPGPPAERLRLMEQSRSPYILAASQPPWDVAFLTGFRPDFVVVSQFEEADERRLRRPDYIAFGVALEQHYMSAVAWGAGVNLPHDLLYIQPKVTVWARR